MKIGILGSGNVGQSLATAFKKAGHDVKIATRDLTKESIQQWEHENDAKDTPGTFAETAAFGEVLILCTKWQGAENAIHLSGKQNFKGKIVIDTMNPMEKEPDDSGRLNLAIGQDTSAGEQVQQWLPEAKVVKAMNCIGAALMDHPYFEEGAPTMFIAGNDEKAKQEAEHLLHQIGWSDVEDMGTIEMSRNIEPLSILWVSIGLRTGNWHHAFRLLRK